VKTKAACLCAALAVTASASAGPSSSAEVRDASLVKPGQLRVPLTVTDFSG